MTRTYRSGSTWNLSHARHIALRYRTFLADHGEDIRYGATCPFSELGETPRRLYDLCLLGLVDARWNHALRTGLSYDPWAKAWVLRLAYDDGENYPYDPVTGSFALTATIPDPDRDQP